VRFRPEMSLRGVHRPELSAASILGISCNLACEFEFERYFIVIWEAASDLEGAVQLRLKS